VQKLLLNSVLFFTVAIPVLSARDPLPKRGLKKALIYTLLFDLAYLVGVLYVYPRLH
jgi:hypothetical protein